jgi:hypothetical protein
VTGSQPSCSRSVVSRAWLVAARQQTLEPSQLGCAVHVTTSFVCITFVVSWSSICLTVAGLLVGRMIE